MTCSAEVVEWERGVVGIDPVVHVHQPFGILIGSVVAFDGRVEKSADGIAKLDVLVEAESWLVVAQEFGIVFPLLKLSGFVGCSRAEAEYVIVESFPVVATVSVPINPNAGWLSTVFIDG